MADNSPWYVPQSVAPILDRAAQTQVPMVSQPMGLGGQVGALGNIAQAGFGAAADANKKQSVLQAQQKASEYMAKINSGSPLTQQDHADGSAAFMSLGLSAPTYDPTGAALKKAQLADLTIDPRIMAGPQKDMGIEGTIPPTKENFNALMSESKTLGENKEKRAAALKDQKTKAGDEKFWASNLKEFSTTNTKRGSLLGQAVLGNSKADRALTEISLHPNAMTPQLKSMITQDLTAIMQGGSPHEQELRAQGYGTLADRFNNLVMQVSGNPQATQQPAIIKELKDVLLQIKSVDNKIVRQNTALFEATNSEEIGRNPAKWAKLKQIIENGLTAPGESPASGGNGGGTNVGNDPLGIR